MYLTPLLRSNLALNSITYKLHYFNLNARAELIRLLFAYGQIQYEDIRYEFDTWPKHKQSGLFPFKKLPVLEIDDKIISQSTTICRYLARIIGIEGQYNIQKAMIDMIAETCTRDIAENTYHYRSSMRVPDESERVKKGQKFFTTTLEPFLINLDTLYQKIGGDYIIGNKLSYADLAYYRMISNVESIMNNFSSSHPKLSDLYLRIAQEPKVKEWEEIKPKVRM